MTQITPIISPLISGQFPAVYREQGPRFVAFMEAYYEWLETGDRPLAKSRQKFVNRDVDSTPEAFVRYFREKYLASIPDSVLSDKRFLVKHILDLYRAKGSRKAYELLFRMVFNESIEVYYPGNDVFKTSAAEWYVPQYIEVSGAPEDLSLADLIGQDIRSTGGATAVVEDSFTRVVSGRQVNVLLMSSVIGEFRYGERVYSIGVPEFTPQNGPIIFGSLSSIAVKNGGINYAVGDILDVEGSGVEGRARVVATRDENGKIDFTLINGGQGFSMNALVTVEGGFGSGATFRVGGLVDKEIYRINTDMVSDYYNTQLVDDALGLSYTIASNVGTFTNGETVTANQIATGLDVLVQAGAPSRTLYLANTSLGISLLPARVDGNFVVVKGTNANLAPGVILTDSNGCAVTINSVWPRSETLSATVFSSNSSTLIVTSPVGYVSPSANGLRHVERYGQRDAGDRADELGFPESLGTRHREHGDSDRCGPDDLRPRGGYHLVPGGREPRRGLLVEPDRDRHRALHLQPRDP